MKIYKIRCEFEMPIAQGYFTTKEKAQKAINDEEWGMCGCTLEEVLEGGMVEIIEIDVK